MLTSGSMMPSEKRKAESTRHRVISAFIFDRLGSNQDRQRRMKLTAIKAEPINTNVPVSGTVEAGGVLAGASFTLNQARKLSSKKFVSWKFSA